MNNRLASLFLALALPTALAASGDTALTARYTMELHTPVNDSIRAQAANGALGNLRFLLQRHLEMNMLASWDTTNAVDSAHFARFVDRCMEKASSASSWQGHDWTFYYTLPYDDLEYLVNRWNGMHDALAGQAYANLVKASRRGDMAAVYRSGVRHLYHAAARLGEPLAPERVDSTRTALREAAQRIQLSSTGMILAGKPGFKPEKTVIARALIDSTSFSEVHLVVILPDGRELLAQCADASGRLSLASVKLPYVAHGSFFHVRPNPGFEVDSMLSFSLRDLDPVLPEHEHSMMFKLTPPRFSLAYQAAGVSAVSLPARFEDKAWLASYLADQCHMQPAQSDEQADISFDVKLQVLSYFYDRTEKNVLKMEVQYIVREETSPIASSIKELAVYAKEYKMGVEPPVGEFLWECAADIRETIASILARL